MQHLGLTPTDITSTLHGVLKKNFVVVIFGVWIFGLLHLAHGKAHYSVITHF